MSKFEVLKEADAKASFTSPSKCRKLSRKGIVKKNQNLLRITKLDANGKYSYKFGEKLVEGFKSCSYPGLIVGHGKCSENGDLVPKYMGWLWNVETLGINKVRKGWCPGAIPTPVKEIMNSFLNKNQLEDQENFNCASDSKISTDKAPKASQEDIHATKCELCELNKSRVFKDMETQYDVNDVAEDSREFKSTQRISSKINEHDVTGRRKLSSAKNDKLSINKIEENRTENEAFSNGIDEKFNSKQLIGALNNKSSQMKEAFESDLRSSQNRKTFPSHANKNMSLVGTRKTLGAVPKETTKKQQKSSINDPRKSIKYVITYFLRSFDYFMIKLLI